jgi:hypothetical protein
MARTLSWRSGWLLACPHEPDMGHREGSLVKSAAALELLTGASAGTSPSRQPTGVGAAVAGASAGAEASAPWRRCVRPGGPP